jgi:biotin transport system substrate-specific component
MATASPTAPAGPLVLADLVPGARARDVVLVVGGALLTAALAQVVVPVPGSPVPITGQTLAVVLVAAGLGPGRGVAAMGLYLAAGLVGLPFYSGAESGYDAVAGATGGYLLGFVPAALLIGLAARHGADRRFLAALPLFLAGQLVVFAVGVPWLAASTGMSPAQAVAAGFTPFILGGVVKALLAAALLPAAWRLARRTGA